MKDFESKKVTCEKVAEDSSLDKEKNSNDNESDYRKLIENREYDNINGFKDIWEFVNKDGFNIKNINFENLKKQLKPIYNNERLSANTINHIRISFNSSVEILWEIETMKSKILVKSTGAKKIYEIE